VANGKWAEFDAKKQTDKDRRNAERERKAYEKAKSEGRKTYSYGFEDAADQAGNSFTRTISKSINDYGITRNWSGEIEYADLSDEQFNNLLNRSRLSYSRQSQINEVSNPSKSFSSTTKSNEYGGDWLNSNSNYSYDNLKTMAKDMATQQLDTQDKLMGLSYGYRTKEKDLDSTIRQRENDQKFGFEKNLQEMSNAQQLKIQGNQYGQEQLMFDKGTTADNQKTESARRAANSLFYGRRAY
jgi:hypothetical protein